MTNQRIRQIKVAQKKLALNDDVYRRILQEEGQVTSSRQLNRSGFAAVMRAFKKMGFVSTAAQEAINDERKAPGHASHAQKLKIAREWQRFTGRTDDMGLDTWLKHKFGIDHRKFMSAQQAQKAIGALSHFPSRRIEHAVPQRSENIQRHLLKTADAARPYGIYIEAMLGVIQAAYPDATHREIRCELDCLEDRKLVEINKDPMDRCVLELTRDGIDLLKNQMG